MYFKLFRDKKFLNVQITLLLGHAVFSAETPTDFDSCKLGWILSPSLDLKIQLLLYVNTCYQGQCFLRPILQNYKPVGVLVPNDSFKAENWLNLIEKAPFIHTVTKSVKPIFQRVGPILQHSALEETLIRVIFYRNIGFSFYIFNS